MKTKTLAQSATVSTPETKTVGVAAPLEASGDSARRNIAKGVRIMLDTDMGGIEGTSNVSGRVQESTATVMHIIAGFRNISIAEALNEAIRAWAEQFAEEGKNA